MEILKLIQIDGPISGGSTKPLLITAMDSTGAVDQYVMKLYKKDYVLQNYSVAKEILISELAVEFDLAVPDYAIIEIDHSLLSPYFEPTNLLELDKGYKFCSKFNGQYVIFNPLVSLQFIKEYDIANLFAFDNAIFNSDRGGFRNKPNLLVNDHDILLIDHEQTLPFINNNYNNPNYFTYLLNYPYSRHIVNAHLKALRSKKSIFDDFLLHLGVLNIKKFDTIFNTFDQNKILYGKKDFFISYLHWLKNKRAAIWQHLDNIIR